MGEPLSDLGELKANPETNGNLDRLDELEVSLGVHQTHIHLLGTEPSQAKEWQSQLRYAKYLVRARMGALS